MSQEIARGVVDFWGAEALSNVLSWPDENLVRFLGSRFPNLAENAGKSALEIGCGNGRNLFALVKQRFKTTGIDISEDAANNCRSILNSANLKCNVITGSFQDTSFSPERFDLIVWDSPFIDTQAGMARGFSRSIQLLKAGGLLWVKFRHPDSWFSGLGKCIEEGTFLLDVRAGAYSGALYSFHDRAQALKMLLAAGFEISNIERVELWKKNELERHVWTVFWAYKPH
jgi:SAM-dependent methyltransferase